MLWLYRKKSGYTHYRAINLQLLILIFTNAFYFAINVFAISK